MQKDNSKSVKIWWEDAVIYSSKTKARNRKFRPTPMVTEGVVVRDNTEGVVIEKPHTIYVKSQKPVIAQEGATFLFIPKGMIRKIKKF